MSASVRTTVLTLCVLLAVFGSTTLAGTDADAELDSVPDIGAALIATAIVVVLPLGSADNEHVIDGSVVPSAGALHPAGIVDELATKEPPPVETSVTDASVAAGPLFVTLSV
jgi:hypothetical protein